MKTRGDLFIISLNELTGVIYLAQEPLGKIE